MWKVPRTEIYKVEQKQWLSESAKVEIAVLSASIEPFYAITLNSSEQPCKFLPYFEWFRVTETSLSDCLSQCLFAQRYNWQLLSEGTLLEGTTQSMDLDSASIAAFSVLVDFVYTQTLKNEANGKFLPELEILVETAILADYVMMPKLYDSTIQGIKQLILQRKQPESGVILKCNLDWNWFMDNTKTGTPIRHRKYGFTDNNKFLLHIHRFNANSTEVMIDFWAFDVTPKILRQQSKNLPHAMLAEISVATRTFLEDEKFLKTLRRAALANEATYVQKPDDPPLDFRWWKRKKSSGSPAEVQRWKVK